MFSVKALTFDFWGTLVDVDSSGINGMAAVLESLGQAKTDPGPMYFAWDQQTVRHYRSGPWLPYVEHSANALSKILGPVIDRSVKADWLALSDLLIREMTSGAKPHPEVPEVIAFLKERYPLMPITNMDDNYFDLNPFKKEFSQFITAQQAGAYKPSERIFRAALSKLGREPEEVLHVSLAQFADLEGAKPVGMNVAWINRGGEELGCYTPEPNFEFPNLLGVMDLLDN